MRGWMTGQATTELTPFRHIIGVDPSAKMIDQARASISVLQSDPNKKLLPGAKLEFVQSAAEDLGFLGDGSVDLLVAGVFTLSLHVSAYAAVPSIRRSIYM